MNVVFDRTLKDKEMPAAIEAYYNFFTNLYGMTRLASEIDFEEVYKNPTKKDAMDHNINEAIIAINMLRNREISSLSIANNQGELIAIARWTKRTVELILHDIVLFNNASLKDKMEIYEKVLAILTEICNKEGIKTLYVESPRNDNELNNYLVSMGMDMKEENNEERRSTNLYDLVLKRSDEYGRNTFNR